MTTIKTKLTPVQADILRILSRYKRLNWSSETMRSTKGMSGPALAALHRRGLVDLHYFALTNATYVELTEKGFDTALFANLVFVGPLQQYGWIPDTIRTLVLHQKV